jgi:hypothetical protein
VVSVVTTARLVATNVRPAVERALEMS